jgi:hypothetical protein
MDAEVGGGYYPTAIARARMGPSRVESHVYPLVYAFVGCLLHCYSSVQHILVLDIHGANIVIAASTFSTFRRVPRPTKKAVAWPHTPCFFFRLECSGALADGCESVYRFCYIQQQSDTRPTLYQVDRLSPYHHRPKGLGKGGNCVLQSALARAGNWRSSEGKRANEPLPLAALARYSSIDYLLLQSRHILRRCHRALYIAYTQQTCIVHSDWNCNDGSKAITAHNHKLHSAPHSTIGNCDLRACLIALF